MTPLPLDELRIVKLIEQAERLEARIVDLTIEEIADLSEIYRRMSVAAEVALANAKKVAQ